MMSTAINTDIHVITDAKRNHNIEDNSDTSSNTGTSVHASINIILTFTEDK